jgi:hypothetical protein
MPSPVIVQTATNQSQVTSGTTATLSSTFTNNTSPGNTLVACWGIGSSFASSISSFSTNGSAENWNSAVNATEVANNQFSGIWYDWATGGGQTVVDMNVNIGGTATGTNGLALFIATYEVRNLLQTNNLDKTVTANNTGQTTWATSTTTTAAANEIWFGTLLIGPNAASTSETFGVTGSWTTVAGGQSEINTPIASADYDVYQLASSQIVRSTGTLSYSGTNSVSSGYAVCAASFLGVNQVGTVPVTTPGLQYAPGNSCTLGQAINRSSLW